MSPEEEKQVSKWWNSVCKHSSWSGAVINLPWDELWPEAKADISEIYTALKEAQ